MTTPLPLLERHGTDAVRYWAAGGRLGADTAFDEGQMKVGRKLAIKILNASKFVLGRLDDAQPEGGGPAGDGSGGDGGRSGSGSGSGDASEHAVTEPLDRDLLRRLSEVVSQATAALEAYDHTRALEIVEAFFWDFCDDYVELVKSRAYGATGEPPARSARAALALSLSVQLRLLAPFLPFVTEEVWSWWQAGSIHRAPWPDAGREIVPVAGPAAGRGDAGGSGTAVPVLTVAADVLGAVRRQKTMHKRSMRARVTRLQVVDSAERLSAFELARRDVVEAGAVDDGGVEVAEGPFSVTVELEPDGPPGT